MKKLIFFLLLPILINSIFAQNQIVEYEYWVNEDIGNKITHSVAPTALLELETELDFSAVNSGFNTINIRFKDKVGKFSPTFSQYFFKAGKSNADENDIVEIEYWVDDDYDSHQRIEIDGGIDINEFADLKSLSNGFHRFHVRFKDESDLWSPTISKIFFKAGSGNSDENLIVQYRYWIDGKFDNAKTVKLQKALKLFEINSIIELPDESAETFSIQFLDTAGLWSSAYTRAFIPEAEFDIFNTINTFTFQNQTTFGGTYKWDFGDGNKSEQVHPSHTYTIPGVYDVCLIANNKLGSDTLCKIVTVNGIREVFVKSAGNEGYATINVYGGGFKEGSKVWLEKDGVKYLEPESVRLSQLDALEARFDLTDQSLNTYDVVVQLPDGTKWKLENGFEIVQATKPQPYANFNGRDRILFGRWQTYTIDFGNTGNNDALGVPIYFMITMPTSIEIEFKNLKMSQSEYWQSNPEYAELLNEPDFIEHTGYFDGPQKVRLYSFFVPIIPANFSGQIEVRIRTNESFKAYTWFNEPMFEIVPGGIVLKDEEVLSAAIDKKTAACLRAVMFQAMKDGIAEVVNNLIPGVGCANSILNLTMDPAGYLAPDPTNPDYNRPKTWREKIWGWGGTVKDVAVVIAGCASDALPLKQAYKTAVAVVSVINNIYGGIQAGRECYTKYGNGKKDIAAVGSFDPNEIVGPGGYASDNFVNTYGFAYTIFFENLATATAPAQEVVIIDTLDKTKYDLNSFSFGNFSFGGKTYAPMTGLKQFTLDIEPEGSFGNIVRVNANFDTQTAIAYWQFITLDPETMDLTEDPDGGFLPPNKTSPQGEGNVSYSVNLLNTLGNEVEINAKADIFFDLNPAITTNNYSNKLDLAPPTSKLNSIHATLQENLYRIEGTSNDDESGVRYRIIHASMDGGEYMPIVTGYDETIYVELDLSNTYHFFSQAIDSVGNVEPMKSNYEITSLNVQSVDNMTIGCEVSIMPNPTSDKIQVKIALERPSDVIISIYDLSGQVILLRNLGNIYSDELIEEINLSEFSNGRYIVRVKTSEQSIIKMLNIIK